MEQNAAAAMPVMDSGNQKSGNGLKIATAIASVVAVCGIGFGIYGMIQSSQKDSQISDLKVQIKEDDGTITTIETPEIETNTDNGTTVTITDSNVKNENTEDYIYIGEWGIKVKIPEGLYIYDYKVKLAETTDFTWYDNAPHIVVSGFTKQLTASPTIPEECYSLVIARTKGQSEGSLSSYDGYSYTVGTDVPCLVDTGYSKEEVDLGGKQLIKEMFSDINNYSKI